MSFDPESISQGKLHALKEAAEKAWGDDTRHPDFSGEDASTGQCYVTSFWLTRKFGGFIGDDNGHYVWVSPDKKYVIDLTCDKHRYIIYKSASHPLYRGMEIFYPKPTKRAERFADRAENIFRNLKHFSRVAMDYAGDGLPAEEPQATNDRERRLDVMHDRIEPKKLNFAYVEGRLLVDERPVEDLIEGDETGPIALGTVDIDPDDHATWTVKTNIGLSGLTEVLENYCNSVGLTCGQVSDTNGHRVATDISYLCFVRQNDNTLISHKQDWSKIANNLNGSMTVGSFKIVGNEIILPNRAFEEDLLSSLNEYAMDHGLKFVLAGNDNVVKRIEDLELDNYSNPDPVNNDGQFFNDPQEEQAPGAVGNDAERINGLYKCPQCEILLPSWREYAKHRQSEGTDVLVEDNFPNTNPDATFEPHFSPRQPQGVGEITFTSAAADESFPIPFIFDVEEDAITVGEPGMEVSDLGNDDYEGTVQGVYENGKLLLKSTTTIPYTVRHLIRLWYYQHPELHVKSVELKTPDGATTKLAQDNLGSMVFMGSLVNPDIAEFSSSVLGAGGEIFAVGDGLLRARDENSLPTDLDLKVAHLNKNAVLKAVESLGGTINLTGFDSGTIQWRRSGDPIKISVVANANEIAEDRVDLRNGRYEQAI